MSVHDYRIEALERQIRDLAEAKPAIVAERVNFLATAVSELRDEVRTMKRAFYAFALSVTGSAIVFALTVFVGR